jgi:hypothetical protein
MDLTKAEAFDTCVFGNLFSISGSERLLAEVTFNSVGLEESPSVVSVNNSEFDPR